MENEASPIKKIDITREKILGAAKRLFAEKGLEGARIDQIARTAGVNQAMIYYVFKSKTDIYQTVLESVVKEIASTAGVEINHEGATIESLVNFIHRYFDIFANDGDIAIIFLREIGSGSHVLARIKESNPDCFATFGRTANRINELIEQDVIRKIDSNKYQISVLFLVVVITALRSFMPLLLDDKKRISQDKYFDEWRTFIADLLLNSILPKA